MPSLNHKEIDDKILGEWNICIKDVREFSDTSAPALGTSETLTLQNLMSEFREKFSGQSELSQAILGALEYRGFNDAGKYLDEDISEAVLPIVESFFSTRYEALLLAEKEKVG